MPSKQDLLLKTSLALSLIFAIWPAARGQTCFPTLEFLLRTHWPDRVGLGLSEMMYGQIIIAALLNTNGAFLLLFYSMVTNSPLEDSADVKLGGGVTRWQRWVFLPLGAIRVKSWGEYLEDGHLVWFCFLYFHLYWIIDPPGHILSLRCPQAPGIYQNVPLNSSDFLVLGWGQLAGSCPRSSTEPLLLTWHLFFPPGLRQTVFTDFCAWFPPPLEHVLVGSGNTHSHRPTTDTTQSHKDTDTYTDTHRGKHLHVYTDTQTQHTQTYTDTETYTNTQRGTHTHVHIHGHNTQQTQHIQHTQTYTETHRHTDTEAHMYMFTHIHRHSTHSRHNTYKLTHTETH